MKYVYCVLEHHTRKTDARLHGVYYKRKWAEGKVKQIERKTKGNHGYLAVLRMEVIRPAKKKVDYSTKENNECIK